MRESGPTAKTPGLWTSPGELAKRPMKGLAWDALLAEATRPSGVPNISDQDDNEDVRTLAKALVFARTGESKYRDDAANSCMLAIGTEAGGETLALGRNLVGYVIAADLVGLPSNERGVFEDWLRECLDEPLQGRTLRSTHEDRPNNWGTHAGASRIAVAIYLRDKTELRRAAQVFHGWLGDRWAYAGFDYGALDWQADEDRPVGVNPVGSTREGHSIDGVLPDDQRRAGPFTWPPPKENYVWEALQGAVVQAELLHRAGYNSWEWCRRALFRAATWLHDECKFPAQGDDTFLPHLLNHAYGSNFPAPVPSKPGKNMAWTCWTHGK